MSNILKLYTHLQKNMNHEHCYHIYHGILMMVVPDGHIVQKCCGCESMKTKHKNYLIKNGCVKVDITW